MDYELFIGYIDLSPFLASKDLSDIIFCTDKLRWDNYLLLTIKTL